jgi:RNA polymerase sigma factor (TIGR02999 family)
MSPPHDVTRLLEDWSQGKREALDALIPLVHDELHRLAKGYLLREKPGHTLQATALVNEAYMRLVGERSMQWQNRAHFIGVAALLMRFILVDHSRKKKFLKRGGDVERVPFDESLEVTLEGDEEIMALDAALTKLAAQDQRKSRIAELRYFGGLSVVETAEVLSVSEATVTREWRLTRAWLRRELS